MASFNPLQYPLCLGFPLRLAPSQWTEHVPFAMFLVEAIRPRVVVELGTHYGVSYCAFCQAIKALALDARAYAIDHWQGDQHTGRYEPEVLEELRRHHEPLYSSFSRLVQSTFDESRDQFADSTIDLLHIDGCHTYDAVRHDFNHWLPKMRPGGVVLLHDINVRENHFGVWRFWDEIGRDYPSFAFVHQHGLGVLAVGSSLPEPLQPFVSSSGRVVREFFSQLGYRLSSRLQWDIDRRDSLTRLEGKDREIGEVRQSYQRKLDRSERELLELNNAWIEKDQAIRFMQSQLAAKDRVIRHLEHAILEMTRSRAWRLVQVLRSVSRPVRALRHIKFGPRPRTTGMSAADYARWIRQNEPTAEDLEKQRRESFPRRPKISIIVPTYNTPLRFLDAMVQSVVQQTYPDWELCVADASPGHPVRTRLKAHAGSDRRIKVRFLSENRGIAGNTNEALALASGDFVAFLDHDDTLAPFALYEVAAAVNRHPDADVFYSDEDKIDTAGRLRQDPHFKPDWSPDTLRSHNYMCHLSIFRRDLMERLGGLSQGVDGSQDYDLVLRATEKAQKIVHIPKVLYHWRIHPDSAAATLHAKKYAFEAAKKALAAHLDRCDEEGMVLDGAFLGVYQIRYPLTQKHVVSIIIPTRDQSEVLRRCLLSLRRSTYTRYEVILVENKSVQPETFAYYDRLRSQSNLRIMTWEGPFNFAAVNNAAVKEAQGDVLLFLNNDVEVITPDWLERLLEHVQRPEIGAAGAKLYFPDDTVQHGGVILGVGGIASHAHVGWARPEAGYFGRLAIIQNVTAVTGACLMTRRAVFAEVGGFDERFVLAYNDVDLCLKMREKGYRIIWTPYAELYHHESKTRGLEDTPAKEARLKKEVEIFLSNWRPLLVAGDPYYNPNLAVRQPAFSPKVIEEGEQEQPIWMRPSAAQTSSAAA
jgi:GT2 family glycosyltransferase